MKEKKKKGKNLVVNLLAIILIKKDFDISVEICKIRNHIIESTKKSLIGKISKRLIELKL